MRNIILGILNLLLAAMIVLVPRESFSLVVLLLSLSMFIRGFSKLFYYFTMARHMVGGKAVLYRAVIMLDLALFTTSISAMSPFIILFYLLGVYAFSGAIDILRSLEARRFGMQSWKFKFWGGLTSIAFSAVLLVIGFISTDFLVYGYAVSLVYSAVIKIISAFRKTSVVYIQ